MHRHAVPTDVRNREFGLKPLHTPSKHSESGHPGGLVTAFEQRLETETNPEKRPVGAQVLTQGLPESQGSELVHHAAEAAHSRKHQHLGIEDVATAARHLHGLPHMLEGIDHTANVSGPVVEK